MTPNRRKAAIATAFGAAAADYDGAAVVQHEVAGHLAERIAALPLPPNPLVLEIGCGTGFLTRAVRGRLPGSRWVASDLSPAMVSACRDGTGEEGIHFLCMDGEHLAVRGGFDLICSNLAFQWFETLDEPLQAMRDRLAPGGWLAFTTLACETFQEWRAAHAALGLTAGTPRYPTPTELAASWPDGGSGSVRDEALLRRYSDPLTFVATLKRVGAHAAQPSHRPLGAGDLRRVLRLMGNNAEGVTITYHVAYAFYRRGET
ncbi:MAG: methyltransferase domain-containing protein [Alphaproteobacteria bacterium]